MPNPPPPTQQQAEEAQRSRYAAELAILSLFVSSGKGGGGGEGELSALEAAKITAILAALATTIVVVSFPHGQLMRSPDTDRMARDALPDAQSAFHELKTSDLPDEQRAVLWSTWAYSEAADRVARAVNEGLAPPELLGKTLRKVWISRSDRKVRPLHAKLHGKTIPVTSDFWRWPDTGQRLRWPGDRDAPTDAVIGCRCVSLLTWADQGSVSKTIRKIVDSTDPEV